MQIKEKKYYNKNGTITLKNRLEKYVDRIQFNNDDHNTGKISVYKY